jgi:hypothetical protein
LHVETLEDRCLLSGTGASLAALPLMFEPNVGQADPAVRYLAHGSGYALALTETGATLNLQQAGAEAVLQMEFVGPGLTPQITGLDLQGGHSNYLLGADPSHWLTDIPQYSRVQYQQIYPGIDLVFYGNNQGQLEYDFVLTPGADPGQVHLRFTGDDSLTVDGQGDLVLHFAGGDVVQQAPLVYQGPAGGRVPVAAAYSLRDDGTVGLTLGGYDASQALVIDPVLTYSTYLGGSGADAGQGIAVDATGTYLTGSTTSLNFPTANPFQGTNHGNTDAFVAKLNPAGSALIYSTYFGGSGTDIARGIAVDAAGNAYITGSTTSTDLPTTVNAFQAANAGGTDAFIAKLNSTGSALLYSTYLGGSGDDQANGIALEGTNAVVAGQTSSTNFPTLSAAQGSNAGGMDAFVVQLNGTGQALVFATYLGGSNAVGGSGNDAANGVAVNASGAIGVAGVTGSADFHTFAPFQSALHGLQDAFVAKFTAAGGLVYSTYLGGSNLDSAAAIALDAAGDVYVTGNTNSPDFPPSTGGANRGITSAFVTELNPAGSALVYSRILSGSGADAGTAIAVDQQGVAYVTGSTTSTDFPTLNAVQPTYGGNGDAFVAALASRGIETYSTYLGGSGSDAGTGIAVVGDVNHSVVVTGSTTSTDFPTVAPLQPAAGGGGDAFVAQVPYVGDLVYNEASSTAQLVVRRSGNNLQLLRDGLLIWQLPLANVDTVLISGGASLTVDNLSGGLFAPRGTIQYRGPAEFVTDTGNGDVFTAGTPTGLFTFVVVNGVQLIALDAAVVNLLGSAMDRFNADPGPLDTLHSGQGATLVGTPTHSIFSLAGVDASFAPPIVAYGFGAVTARVTSATLFDSAGNDTLVATRSSATLSGPGYSLTVNDVGIGGYTFSVAATASTGNDFAILSTSNSNDTLYAQPGYASLFGPNGLNIAGQVLPPVYLFTAVNFGTVRTYANGGTASAYLTGSPGNDIFVGTPTYSYLAGSNYLLFVSGFVQVNAMGGGGSDAAFLYDSAGDDLFRGTSTYSFLSGTGFMNVASGFYQVTAVAGSGGSDTADLYAGPGDNYYSGADSGGVLVGTGYSIAVNHFAVVRATASTDGTNLLFLSALDYVFQPIGNWH